MEAIYSPQTAVYIHHTARRYVLEDSVLYGQLGEPRIKIILSCFVFDVKFSIIVVNVDGLHVYFILCAILFRKNMHFNLI
jgi:hypothetical protein